MTTNELKMKKIQDYLEFDLSLIERVSTKRALIENLVESHFDSMALSNPMEEKFIQAVLKLDLEKIEYYLQQGVDPNIKTLRGVYGKDSYDTVQLVERTPLDLALTMHHLTWGRDEKAGELLLKYGAERDYYEVFSEEDCSAPPEFKKDDLGERLMQACKELDIEAAKMLLQDGANPNYIEVGTASSVAKCFQYNSPLTLTVNEYGSTALKLEMIQLLFEHGADVNAVSDAFLLEELIYFREIEMIQLLIENGLDLSETDKYGNTALHVLMRHPTHYGVDILDLMLLNGADIHAKNDFGFTPLHAAVQTNMMETSYSSDASLDMISHLVKLGANMYEPDNQGYSALFWSLHSPDIQEALFEGEIANFIYELPDDNHLEDKFIQSCLDKDIIRMADLIEKGVDIDFSTLRQTESYSEPSEASRTCLDITIEQTYENPDIVDYIATHLLLKNGASMDNIGGALENSGYRYDYFEKGYLGFILLSYGADPIKSGLKDILKFEDDWLTNLLKDDYGKNLVNADIIPAFDTYISHFQQPDAIPLTFLPEDFFG
jgi:hypothetical protein